jgi:hypothetical protein
MADAPFQLNPHVAFLFFNDKCRASSSSTTQRVAETCPQ